MCVRDRERESERVCVYERERERERERVVQALWQPTPALVGRYIYMFLTLPQFIRMLTTSA